MAVYHQRTVPVEVNNSVCIGMIDSMIYPLLNSENYRTARWRCQLCKYYFPPHRHFPMLLPNRANPITGTRLQGEDSHNESGETDEAGGELAGSGVLVVILIIGLGLVGIGGRVIPALRALKSCTIL